MMDGISGLIAGTMATAFAAVAMDGSMVSVETVAKIAIPVGGMVWWLSSKFRGIDDNQAVILNSQSALNNRIDSVLTRLDRIEVVLRNCPEAKVDCS